MSFKSNPLTHIVTASEMQQMDRETIESFGLPGRVLMENAGRGVIDVMVKTFPDICDQSIGIIAGRGNNGGDGFVIARYLSGMGASVSVYLFSERMAVKGDAAANLELMDALKVPVVEITDPASLSQHHTAMRHHQIWVDALLGTGLNAEVKGLFRAVIEFLNSLNRPIIAVDIPSGLNADTGMICGACIQAHTTVTFGFPKIGHVLFPGADVTGCLEIVDIGIPPHIVRGIRPRHHILTPEAITCAFPQRAPTSHKGTAGHVLVVGGSTGKAGAAAMSGLGALRSGAGLVTLAIPKSLNVIIQSQIPEIMTAPMDGRKEGLWDDSLCDGIREQLHGKKCLAIGPGMGASIETQKLVLEILRGVSIPVVLDADGLNCVSGQLEVLKRLKAPAILTPHPGEMSRLTGESVSDIQADRIGTARRFSRTHHVHLVLKGARTIIAHPDGTVYINLTANPGMATGGMGDVLTGVIAGLLAQGLGPEDASRVGVYLHGKAADALCQLQGPFGFLASEVAGALPGVIREMMGGRLK
ncbi:MAG: NAD(P)H-hydrate dehydratase [Deltaproteobacteria bacterium]|nr:NAD(P)H-hydrate dehydratase [Deltaproteobacteria bacterium]